MPLYRKTISKARVKTQNSFISPVLSQISNQNNIKDLIKDDYKGNLPICTKNKRLEPLINNISNDGALLDKLQTFKDSSKTLIEVSKTTKILKKETTPKFTDLLVGSKSNKNSSRLNKSTTNSTKCAKSKELTKTFSDLTAQSPLLFDSSTCSSIQKNNKRLKTENSTMTITTKIEISSSTDGDHFNIKRASAASNSELSTIINNLRKSQELLNSDYSNGKNSRETTINADEIHSIDQTMYSKMEDETNDLDSSLRDILDDVVNTNIVLSQKMMNDHDSIKYLKKDAKNNNKEKNIQRKQITKKSKTDVKKKAEKSKENIKAIAAQNSEDNLDASLRSILDDVVNTNILLSQQMNDNMWLESLDTENKDNKINKGKKRNITPERKMIKTKAELKQVFCKSKENNTTSKSKENVKSLTKSREVENKKSDDSIIKTKSSKRIRALCSDEEEEPISKIHSKADRLKRNKAKDPGKQLKEKAKNKYLIEKQKPIKGKQANSMNNTNLTTDKKLTGESKKAPPKSKNMIFTSESLETDLKKLLKLQEERDVGLYVYCDTCDKVRHLPQCKDPTDLPAKWHCYMNPDINYNKCTDPDFAIDPEIEENIIHNKYNAGSLVWAKMDGYPWWPAMVDDDPNLTDYFWLDNENSLEPSWYHVTFFDSSEVTRAWIRTADLHPYQINEKKPMFKPGKYDYYRHRLDVAKREAKKAGKMEILERLRTYSFVVRYFKKITTCTGKGKKKKDEIIKQSNADKDNAATPNGYDDFCDIASGEIISDILKPKKGENKIASDEEILERIDFNNFICNGEPFNDDEDL